MSLVWLLRMWPVLLSYYPVCHRPDVLCSFLCSENLLAPFAKTLHIIYQNDTEVSFDMCCPSFSQPPSSFHCIWKQFIILKPPPPLLLIHPCKAGWATLPSVSHHRCAFKKSPRGGAESLTDCPLLSLKASQLSFDISLCQHFGVMLKVESRQLLYDTSLDDQFCFGLFHREKWPFDVVKCLWCMYLCNRWYITEWLLSCNFIWRLIGINYHSRRNSSLWQIAFITEEADENHLKPNRYQVSLWTGPHNLLTETWSAES